MFTYGNYDQYYKQRHDRCAAVDPRIEALLRAHGPELFTQKAVLDLGCNAGFVTLLIASLGAARSEGVDIDLKLIGLALKQLRRLKQEGHTALPTAADGMADDMRFPVSFVHCRGIVPYAMKPLATKPSRAPTTAEMVTMNEPETPLLATTQAAPEPIAAPVVSACGLPAAAGEAAEGVSPALPLPAGGPPSGSAAAQGDGPDVPAAASHQQSAVAPDQVEPPSERPGCSEGSSKPAMPEPPAAPASSRAEAAEGASAGASQEAAAPKGGGSDGPSVGPAAAAPTPVEPRADDAPAFPYNVEFRTENVLVSEVEERRGLPYDVVLCLKLTKWVHLYWGDDGIKVLFHRCFRLLRPGGVLILEAQEWQSYQSAKQMTSHMKQSRASLRLQPQDFTTYLVHVVGFSAPETLAGDPPLKRPLLLFRRPQTSAAVDPAQQATDRLLNGPDVVKAVLRSIATAKDTDAAAATVGAAADSTAPDSSTIVASSAADSADAPAADLQVSSACPGQPPAEPVAAGTGPSPTVSAGGAGAPSAAEPAGAEAGASDKATETLPDSSTVLDTSSSGKVLEESDPAAASSGAAQPQADTAAPPAKRLRTEE